MLKMDFLSKVEEFSLRRYANNQESSIVTIVVCNVAFERCLLTILRAMLVEILSFQLFFSILLNKLNHRSLFYLNICCNSVSSFQSVVRAFT